MSFAIWMLGESKCTQDLSLKLIHCTPMLEPLQMQQSVDKKKRETPLLRSAKTVCLALCRGNIEKNFALGRGERKGKYVRGVCFMSMLVVEFSGQRVAADDHRQLVPLWKRFIGQCFVREPRSTTAYRVPNVDDHAELFRTC